MIGYKISDIVERLRKTHAEVVESDGSECEFIGMFREGADEIERLRAALAKVIELEPEKLTNWRYTREQCAEIVSEVLGCDPGRKTG